jgi:LCP family protein required for cell wall assembly
VSSSSYQPRAPRRVRGKRSPLRVVLALLLVMALAVAGYVWSLAHTYNSGVHFIEDAFPADAERPAAQPGGAVNILLMGRDKGAGSDGGGAGLGGDNGSRADTMMLVHLPADRRDVYVMSILRDTWTEIPGHGEHKINAAASLGGVPLVVQTVEALFGSRVDHVVMLDFDGFEGLTDALGGVEVDNPAAFEAREPNTEFFEKGPITLDGDSALTFVRERYAFRDGDYQRVKNQQLFIRAAMSKVLSPATLANPVRIHRIVSGVSPYLSVDGKLRAGDAGKLAFGLRSVRSDDVHFFTLPDLGLGTSIDGQSVIIKDPAAIAEITDAMRNGSMDKYLETSGAGN